MATTFVDPGPAHYAVKGGTAQAVPYPLWLDDPDPGLWGVVSEPNGLMGSADGGTPEAVLAATEYSFKLGDAGGALTIHSCAQDSGGGSFSSLVVSVSADATYLVGSQDLVLRLAAMTTYRTGAMFGAFSGGEVTTIHHWLDRPVPAAMLAYLQAAIAADPGIQEMLSDATEDIYLGWLLFGAPEEATLVGGLRYTRRSDGIYLGVGGLNQMVFSAEDFAAFAPQAGSLGLWGGHGSTASYSGLAPEEIYIGHYEFTDAPAEAFWTGHVLTFER